MISKRNLQYLNNVSLEDRFKDSIQFMDELRGYCESEIDHYFLPHEIPEYLKLLKQYNKTADKIQKLNLDLKDNYRYLLTFTLKDDPTKEYADEVEAYIIKQLKRKPLKIVEAYIAREHTQNGRPHWHVAIETTKSFDKYRMKYYTKKYGFIDSSRTRSQSLKNAIAYISKETEPIKII